MKKRKKLLGMLVPAFLSILFCLISMVALSSLIHMQGHARVVNYAGIVRGATQRLIKQEMNGSPNDELVHYLDGLVSELATGEGENDLTALPDETYQMLMAQMRKEWKALKEEIIKVREGQDSQQLFFMSEEYFELANQAVTAAEQYSEECVKNSIGILVCLNIGFIFLGIFFWITRSRQEKIQRELEISEHANHAKSEFFSRMSHEIRTPMNGIIGMAAIAKKSADDPKRTAECLDKIELSAGYLMSLLNDVLDMSRIESGKMELEYKVFNLTEIFDRISVMFKEKAEERNIKLELLYDTVTVTRVVGDSLRISQVLVNLVSNALKFTPPGGTVTLNVQEKSKSKEKISLEFTVTDTGIGISEEFQARIFDPFEQEESYTARQYGGTGLGLAICQNFVHIMGGDIAVHSKIGEGAAFTVTLTLLLPGPEDAKERAGSAVTQNQGGQVIPDLEGMRILLAEDNELNAEIVTEILGECNAYVEKTANGKEAVDKFKESPEGTFALILMDIQMPVMDGLEACRSIRAMDRADAKEICMIGLSANAFKEDVDRAMECGMNGYLCKPIELGQLYQTMNMFIKKW